MVRALPVSVFALAAMIAGCDQVILDLGGTSPDGAMADEQIIVYPETLDFGELEAGTSLTRLLTVANGGGRTLHLEELALDGSGSFSVAVPPQERVVAPGEAIALEVIYEPEGFEVARAELTIRSSDPEAPETVVPLLAGGLAPSIQVTPSRLDLGGMDVGCEVHDGITIRNTGSQPLTISAIDRATTSDDLFIDVPPDLPLTLSGQESITLDVRYLPGDDQPDAAYLVIDSDDPVTPHARATITGDAGYAGVVEDPYEQTYLDTDVLLVIDNSCSMEPFQDALASNAAAFIEVLDNYAPEFHIAVITTDSPLFHGPYAVMDAETPDLAAAFAAAVMVGTQGQAVERGLSSAAEALAPTLSGDDGLNAGFLRDEAILRVLFVSDEDDQSPGSVEDYLDDLRSIKPSGQGVIVSAVSGQDDGCVHDQQQADPAPRYQSAIAMTEGLSESICAPSWTDTLATPEWLTSGLMRSFPLSETPIPATLVVLQNGVPVTEGWAYDEWSNEVVFDEDHIPHAGDGVTLSYRPSVCP